MNILYQAQQFYKRNINNEKALDHLQSYNITSREALEAFGVGFANSGLTKHLSSDQFDSLVDSGLIDSNGRNRFKQSIIFTLTDLEGYITDFLGQNLGKNGAIKTIHNESKGIGNAKALQVTDDIIATDYPFLALSLYQQGIKNVIITPDESAMKMVKAKRVTFVSYRDPDKKAESFEAEEVLSACMNPKYKTPLQAIEKARVINTPVALKTPRGILDKVADDLSTLGYVGEIENKKIAYLVSISRKLSRPLSAIIISSSGAGKTGLMRAVANLVPNEDKLFLSRLTPNALYHMPKDALVEKLIVVDERNGSSMADYSIRTMQTSNVLTLARPKSKDAKDGIKSINVKCAYMESTTSDKINPENASRCFLLHLDESPQATEAVLSAQRKARNGGKGDTEELLRWHHDYQRSLSSLPVAIPFVNELSFPNHKVGYRREQEKFLSLIEASALLHQTQREIKNDVIQASAEDYAIVYELFKKIFSDMEREVSRNALILLKKLEEVNAISFSMREAITMTGWSYSSLNRTIKELLQYEYLSQDHAKNGKKRTYTRLDYSIYGKTIGRLKPPQELSKTFSAAFHDLANSHDNEIDNTGADEIEITPEPFQETGGV